MPSVQAAASSRGVEVLAAPVRVKDEIEGIIAEQARNHFTPGSGHVQCNSQCPLCANSRHRARRAEASLVRAYIRIYANLQLARGRI